MGTYAYTPVQHAGDGDPERGDALHVPRTTATGSASLKQLGARTTTYYLRGLGQVLSEFEEEADAAAVDGGLRAPGRAAAGGDAAAGRDDAADDREGGRGHGTVTSTPSGHRLRADLQRDDRGVRGGHGGDADGDAGAGLGVRGVVGRPGLRGRGRDADGRDDVRGDVRADGAAVREAGAADGGTGQHAARDAAVGGGAERELLGLLGHDEQWRLRHGVAVPTATATSRVVDVLATGTYYWQVKTVHAAHARRTTARGGG